MQIKGNKDWIGITKDTIYNVIEKDGDFYKIINDFGDVVLMHKKYFY